MVSAKRAVGPLYARSKVAWFLGRIASPYNPMFTAPADSPDGTAQGLLTRRVAGPRTSQEAPMQQTTQN